MTLTLERVSDRLLHALRVLYGPDVPLLDLPESQAWFKERGKGFKASLHIEGNDLFHPNPGYNPRAWAVNSGDLPERVAAQTKILKANPLWRALLEGPSGLTVAIGVNKAVSRHWGTPTGIECHSVLLHAAPGTEALERITKLTTRPKPRYSGGFGVALGSEGRSCYTPTETLAAAYISWLRSQGRPSDDWHRQLGPEAPPLEAASAAA